MLFALIATAALGQTQQLTAEPAPAPAPARPGRHMVEVGGYLGAFVPSSEHELYDSNQSPQGDFSALGPQLGLRIGYFPWSFVGAEGEGGFSMLGLEGDEGAAVYNTRAHLVLQLPGRFTPFALGGVGLLGVSGDDGDDVDQAVHWGLGVKYYPSARWSVRLDGRHLVSAREGPDMGNTSHFEATLGLSYAVHRAPERRPPPVVFEEPDPDQEEPETEPDPEPEPAPEPAPVEVVNTIRKDLETIRFSFDSAEVDPSQIPLLNGIAAEMNAYPDVRVTIIGHACSIGTERYNRELSLRRAAAVKRYLEEQGVRTSQVVIDGRGETDPLLPNDTPAHRAQNRRTEFRVEAGRSEEP